MLKAVCIISILISVTAEARHKPKVVDITGQKVDLSKYGLKAPKSAWKCKHLSGSVFSCKNLKASDLDALEKS